MEDIILVCKECGQKFVFSAEEQEFYIEKGFKNKPSKCINCRKQQKETSEAQSMKELLANPERFEFRCRLCGRVFLSNRLAILPDNLKICIPCASKYIEDEGALAGIYGSDNIAVNKGLGYPKFKD